MSSTREDEIVRRVADSRNTVNAIKWVLIVQIYADAKDASIVNHPKEPKSPT